MKKIISLLLVMALCFTLFGCGDSNTLPNETTTAESTTPGVNQTTTSVVIASTDQSTVTTETTTAQTTTPGTYDENDTPAEHFEFTLQDDDTYSVKAGKNFHSVFRHHTPFLQVVFTPPGEKLKFKLKRAVQLCDFFQYFYALVNDFGANPVTRDHRNLMCLHLISPFHL